MTVADYATSGNTTVGGINIATGTSPANVDNALRKIVDDIGEGLAAGRFGVNLNASNLSSGTVPDARLSFTVTAFAKTLLDDGDAATFRATASLYSQAEQDARYAQLSAVMLTTQYAVLTELQTLGVGSDGEYLKNTGGALDWAAIPSTATSKRIYTSSDTWSKPTGLVKIVVTVIGGGGGGGGAANASSGYYHYGGPGAGGGIAVSEVVAASLGSTVTVTIGAGGTAGSTGGGGGGTGGTTSFGAHAVATGGAGGDGENAGTSTSATRNTDVAAGVGTTGNIYVGYGSKGNSEGALYSGIRYGGASAISFGLRQTNTTTSDTAANSPANTGTGGIGGCNIGNTGGRVGGVGGSGLVIVEEYFA